MRVAVIGTSSLPMSEVEDLRLQVVATRYGEVPLHIASFGANEMLLVRRAGARPLEPNRVNYRAYILALRGLGAELILSTCVAGSLRRDISPGALADVSQFIDFTRHRPPTLFDEHGFGYTDMTEPYCPHLRSLVKTAASASRLPLYDDVCYVGVDGPRYETAAEVRMFQTLGGESVEQLVRATVPLMLDQPYGKCTCASSPGSYQLPKWRSSVDGGRD